MCKSCWSIATILLIMVLAMAYKFILQGDVTLAEDNRTAIHLTPSERDLVLSEMRVFLESVKQVTDGIVNDDMPAVAIAARRSGKAAAAAVPGTLIGKLPIGFKKLGSDTHARFDALALDAEQLGDGEHSLSQLNTLMGNCVSCHSAYRFEVDPQQ